jgi:ATP-binding cassette subfamily F protein uup
VRDFMGNYNEYRIQLKEEQRQAARDEKNAQAEIKSIATASKRKLSFKEQSELKQLEQEIETLQTERTLQTAKLSEGETDHVEIQKTAKRIEEIILLLDKKELRWLELSEFA